MEAVGKTVIHYKCGYQFVPFFLFMLNTRQLAHKLMDISSQYWFYTFIHMKIPTFYTNYGNFCIAEL